MSQYALCSYLLEILYILKQSSRECLRPTGRYHSLEPYIMFLDIFADIWQRFWHPESFHAFRISCSGKHFIDDYHQMFSRNGFILCM